MALPPTLPNWSKAPCTALRRSAPNPYGRYAASLSAWQLLLHTNATSIVHEPNRAYAEPVSPELRIGARGQTRSSATR